MIQIFEFSFSPLRKFSTVNYLKRKFNIEVCMGLIAEVDDWLIELKEWRHAIHANPETAFEEFETAAFVAEKLKSFGVDELHTGIAETGIVAVIHGDQKSDKSIALRADLDALNLDEKNSFDYISKNSGKMHACGHDGHTIMLLGAARYLCQSRSFKGTVYCVFQPAEENEGGGRTMVEEGLFEKFPAERVYGMHNWPGLAAGTFSVRSGPVMAAADRFDLIVKGKGGHAAMPHLTHDPLVTAAHLVTALQQLHSRRMNPLDQAVVSITQFHGGDAYNVIPDEVVIRASVRTFTKEVKQQIIEGIHQISKGICSSNNCTYELAYRDGYPSTINDVDATEIAARAANVTVGENHVLRDYPQSLASEDFSFMLQKRPGCYVWLGNGPGEGGCMLHNPHYDFNDEILQTGISYWVNLVKEELK
jgi:amidohydrolase